MLIKLFEQWVSEMEDTQDSIKIQVNSAEAGEFEIIAKESKADPNQFSKTFIAVSSTNPEISKGASVSVSPTIDKDGDFDVVVVNDPKKSEDILTYSGKVNIM